MTTLARRTVLYGLYWLVITVVNWGVLSAWYRYSRADSTASHLILIPIVTLVLIIQSRVSIFSSTRWAVRAGIAAIAAGVAIMAVARLFPSWPDGDALSWMIAAIAILWVGGFLLCFGWPAARAAAFPLLFLAFMIPLPQALLNGATRVLKTGSAEAVAGLFTLSGTTYFRDGFMFSLPGFDIVIADECSGIRSSIALVLTSLLAGDMFLKNGWTKALLVLAALPIAVIKNGIRIVGLSLLALHVDPEYLTGQLHHEGGFVFFLLALAILGPVLHLLRRFEPDNRAAGEAYARP
jgi:exosortase